MSEAAATESPAGETPAAVEEVLAPEDDPKAIYASLFADSESADKPKVEEPAKEEPVVEAAEAADTAEVVEEPPKEEPKKAEPKVELEVAKVERELRNAKSELATEKQARAAVEKKYADFEKEFDANWIAFAEKRKGAPFHELMERAAKGEWDEKPTAAKPDLDDETKEVLAWAKEERKRATEKAAADKRTADKNKNQPLIASFIESVTDDYPVLTALPNATQAVLDLAFEELEKTGRQPDLHKIAAEIEEEANTHSNVYFGNEKVLAALLKDPKRRAAVLALVAPAAPVAAAKTPAVAAPASGRLAAPAEVVSRTAKADVDDEAAERAVHLKGLRSHQERVAN